MPFAEMFAAEEAEAERAFEARVGAAVLDAAEPCPVALEHTRFVGHVLFEVEPLGPAALARTDGLVAGDVVRVGGTEGTAAVLAGVLGRVGAT